jgi:hypothetical protein
MVRADLSALAFLRDTDVNLDMRGLMVQWRQRGAWLQVTVGFVAIVCLLWSGRRFARGIDSRALSALEEFGGAVAPLILLALMWLLAESTRSPNARVRPPRAPDAITTLIPT